MSHDLDTSAIAAQLDDGTQSPALAPPAGARTTTAQPDVKATVMALYEAFDRGALGSFDAVGDAFEARVFGATLLDWPSFVGFGQAFVDAFPDGRHIFDFVVTEGDTVATIGRYRGQHEGQLMGVAATGNEVDFTVMHIHRVQDGRIVEHRGIGDINTMWAQLGVKPPAAG
jgi:predicted ester cyclase